MATKPPAKSNVRVPLQSVTVRRKDEAFTPPIGQPFEFTPEEIEQIEKMNPDAIGTEAKVDVSVAGDGKKDDI